MKQKPGYYIDWAIWLIVFRVGLFALVIGFFGMVLWLFSE